MDINFTLFGEMITFGVLVWFTMRYIWPPIMKAINERQAKIAEGLTNAERATHNLELARTESTKILQTAQNNAANLIEQAQRQVVDILESGRVEAKHEADRIVAFAKTDINQEKIKIQQNLQQETTRLAVQLAEKILRQKIDAKTQDYLITRLIEEIK